MISINYFTVAKSVYPYEYMDDWGKFNETSLPEKEDFYSHVNMENQGLIQDLNLGSEINVSSCWSMMTNIKKYCREIGLLCCFVFNLDKYALL